jgi:hypothetical protein
MKGKIKMSVNKTLALTSRQQLVDLNGETTNFDLTFTATSKDNSSFDVLVVDQTTLDNNPNLEYKRANGTISGNIVSDKNVYQNYFLCLKSDQPCQVDISVDKKEIAPKPQSPASPKPQSPASPIPQHSLMPSQSPPSLTPPVKPSGVNWKVILLTVVIVGGGLSLYYFYTNKKGGNSVGGNVDQYKSPVVSSPATPTPIPTPTPPVKTTNFGWGQKATESMIARLNSLPMK